MNKTGSPSYVFIYIPNRTADKTAWRVAKTINIVSFDFRFVMMPNAVFIGCAACDQCFRDANKKEVGQMIFTFTPPLLIYSFDLI